MAACRWTVIEGRYICHDREGDATDRNLHTYSLIKKISNLGHPALGPGKRLTRSTQLLFLPHIQHGVPLCLCPASKSRYCSTPWPPPPWWPPRSLQIPPQSGCPLLRPKCKQETPSSCGIPIPTSRIIERTGKPAESPQVVSRLPFPTLARSRRCHFRGMDFYLFYFI